MKQFVKITLAVITSLFLFCIIGFFLMLTIIGSLAAVGSTTTAVLPKNAVLTLDMGTVALGEQTK